MACGGQILIVLLLGSRPSHIEVYTPFRMPSWPFHFGDRLTDLAGYSIFLGRDHVFTLPTKSSLRSRGITSSTWRTASRTQC
jgi:hypothetical protein